MAVESPRHGLFARKPLDDAIRETQRSGFKRALGPLDLTSIGVAAIIGAGIFVLLGQVARNPTGPAVVVSLVISGVAAILSAFVYAELASMIPGSGSGYAYAYAALGRFPAFMMGWIMLNAFAVGNMVVSISWSEFFVSGLGRIGLHVPAALTQGPASGGTFNLPAAVIMLLVTLLCLPRIRESSFVNNILVVVKLAIVLFFIVLGATLVRPGNYVPFSPGGVTGVFTGSAVLFFAYLGFDVVSTTAEEAKNPRRDLPLGIVLSLVVSMVLYIAMALVVTGIVRSSNLDEHAPLAAAFATRGYPWAAGIITVGALVAFSTVLYAFQVGLARVLHSMARDGFLPRRLAHLHPTTQTPWTINLVTGVAAALGAGLLNLRVVGDMAVEASIAMYVLVAVGVLALKILEPLAHRAFRTPWPVPAAAILLMLAIAGMGLALIVHLAFLAWLGLGLMLYGFYAHRRAGAPSHLVEP